MQLNKTSKLPDVAEIQNRKNKIIAQMHSQGFDAMVIFDPDNVYWLTNFANFVHERPFILIMNIHGDLDFVVPEIEALHVNRRKIGEITLCCYKEFPSPSGTDWVSVFNQITAAYNQIGFEENCPYFIVEQIITRAKVTPIVEEARFIKSQYEIARINYSSELAVKSFTLLMNNARPGWSASESNKMITDAFMQEIFLNEPSSNFLATRVGVVVQSPNVSFDPHNYTNFPDMDMVEGGPHIAIINSVVNGYGTEVERTFFLGDVPDACIKPYQAMMEAREIAFNMCRPGISMHDLDQAVFDCFTRHGYADNFIHRTGHSIGVTGHEGPFLAMGYHREIQPNMIFTIEPGIYIPGIGGFRHSDTVVVTEDGNVNLTEYPDSLEAMTLSLGQG